MRILLLTDIHGNLPALEAVLRHPAAQGLERIISTGDHTGFGPCPRQVTERLMAQGAVLLAGNHEERLPHALEPEFAGYNWTLLHWTRAQLSGLPLTWPRTYTLEDMLFAHGTPEDPNKLLEASEVPDLLAQLPEGVHWYFSGHNHAPWQVTAHGRQAVNPGSLGLLEDGVGGRAPFAALYTMQHGTYQAALIFVRQAIALGKAHGVTLADPLAFQLAAQEALWDGDLFCEEYWKQTGAEA